MYNEILKLGPVTIHGYGLMIGIGVLAAFLMADRRAKSKGLNADLIFNMGIISLILGFVSAKLLFVILDFKAIITSAHPWQALAGTGFVVYGGIIGGVLTALVYCKIKKAVFLEYFDLAAPSIAIAQGFGRVGCLLAGCCYGRETDSPLGIIFHNSDFAPNGVKLVPTQIMSSLGDFAIALILIWYAGKRREAGRVGGLYIILYAIGRFVIEVFRNDFRGSFGPLSTSQLIAIIMLVPGILLYFLPLWRKRREQTPPQES